MRTFSISLLFAVTSCSSAQVKQNEAIESNSEDAVAACVTEEVLRRANVSEAEIEEFKREEAELEANGVETCG